MEAARQHQQIQKQGENALFDFEEVECLWGESWQDLQSQLAVALAQAERAEEQGQGQGQGQARSFKLAERTNLEEIVEQSSSEEKLVTPSSKKSSVAKQAS